MRKLISILISVAFVYTIHAQALYCTTLHGGTYGGGTICKLEAGKLSAAFSFDTPDGNRPSGNLLQASDGKLYGMTSQGGKYNMGSIFSYDPLTGKYARLKDFDTANGAYPNGTLVQATDGRLYGVTPIGGEDDQGVLFSYDIPTGEYNKLLDFNDVDNGAQPYGSLVRATNGKLYGMTSAGGMNNSGMIFSYSPATKVYTKLVDFNDTIGYPVSGNLLLAKDGKLYGMGCYGGSRGDQGFIFSVNPATGVYTKLIGFTFDPGTDPRSNLIQGIDGKLYGVTYAVFEHTKESISGKSLLLPYSSAACLQTHSSKKNHNSD